jgi:hypothetical protein
MRAFHQYTDFWTVLDERGGEYQVEERPDGTWRVTGVDGRLLATNAMNPRTRDLIIEAVLGKKCMLMDVGQSFD